MKNRIASLCLLALLFPLLAVAKDLSTDARAALAAIEEGAVASNSDALLVMRGDTVLLERYGEHGPRPIELMSATKSVVALAIGALIADGKIESLDTPVAAFFPEWKQGRKQAITVRMLLDHSSGLQNVPSAGEEIYPARDVVQLALAAELSHDPGSHFSYNNKATNLLAGIIEKASGEPMDLYVKRRLLLPLGAESADWYKDAAGNPHAMAGLPLSARGAAAVGRLLLDGGRHQGQALLPSDFIDTLMAPSRLSANTGLLWWRRPAWVRFHADDASFTLLEEAGVRRELVDRLRPLGGRRFDDAQALYAGLAEVLGENWNETWRKEVIAPHGIGPWRPFHPEEGPVEAWEANGYLGQYIVVIPKAGLVAVRQIASREGHLPAHNYQDFTARVQALADALTEAP